MTDQLASDFRRRIFFRISLPSSIRWAAIAFLATIVCIAASAPSAYAMHRRHLKGAVKRSRGPVPFYRAALLEDADTGKVLFEDNAEMQWPPASMAKMMLL